MIDAHDLCFRYPGSLNPALNNVTFSVPSGSIALLCGANGSGKSTMLRLLAGLHRPDHGFFRIGRCALVMDDPSHQILGGTVGEDLLISWPRPSETHWEKARKMSISFGLDMDADAQGLSSGQKHRLCIASALMTDPDVLLMDEPANSLDYSACRHLADCLERLRNAGMTILLSTHDPALFLPAMREDDPILVLEQGSLRASLPLSKAGGAIRENLGWGVRPWE